MRNKQESDFGAEYYTSSSEDDKERLDVSCLRIGSPATVGKELTEGNSCYECLKPMLCSNQGRKRTYSDQKRKNWAVYGTHSTSHGNHLLGEECTNCQ